MVSEQWNVHTIGELIEKGIITVHKDGNHGSNYPRTSEFGSKGVPFLTAKLLDEGGNIDLANAPRLSEAKANSFKFGFIETDDVLLSHNATVGRVAVVPSLSERVLIGTSLTHFRLDADRLLPRYLAAYFSGKDFQNQLAAVMSQTTRNQVPITAQRHLSVVVPPAVHQQAISDVIGSFDEKIELNRQQNRTLEAIAQALFKRWFVEFEFPDENGQPYKSSGGAMQPSDKSAGEPIWTAESRPEGVSAMDGANQLGEMEHVPLSDVVDLNPRCPLKKGQLATYVDMKSLPTSVMSVSEVIQKEFSGGAKFCQGDTLLARITPCLENGKTAYVDFLENDEIAFGSTEFIVMRPREGVSPQFVYCLARDPLFREYAIKSMVGSSGRQRVQVDQIAKFPVLCPTPELMQRYDEVTKPLFDKISSSRKESFTLAKLRDTLLPKLMSGELRIGEAA